MTYGLRMEGGEGTRGLMTGEEAGKTLGGSSGEPQEALSE